MKWSWTIARLGKTEIRLHASLLLLVPLVLLQYRPNSLGTALWALGLVAALFVCIGLHELGHTLMARAFKIEVSAIVLWPLGGFSYLQKEANHPLEDVVIAAAGPVINLAIGFGVGMVLLGVAIWENVQAPALWGAADLPAASHARLFFTALASANLILAVSNLLPVYPLDGGRILRSLLLLAFGQKWANRIMVGISLPLALLLFGYALWRGDVLLALTALLLAMGASTLSSPLRQGLAMGIGALSNRGHYFYLQEDFDRAIEVYSQLLESDPNDVNALMWRSLAYRRIDEIELATVDVERMLRIQPENVIAIALRGELYHIAGNAEQALVCYEGCIQLKPDWNVPYADRANLYRQRGDLSLAEADMEHALALNQPFPLLYLMRAMLRHQLGNLEGARADEQQALKMSSKVRDLLLYPEAHLPYVMDVFDWAVAFYSRMVEQMPASALPYLGRADVYRLAGRHSQALADYNRAAHLDAKEYEIYVRRGQAYRHLGQNEQAVADFRQALGLARRSHQRRRAEQLLKV